MGLLDALNGGTPEPNPASGVADVGGMAAAQARGEVAAELPKRKRGRPAGSGTSANQAAGGGTRQAGTAGPGISSELAAELRKQVEACYDPKAWGALLAAPADVMLSLTGGKHWNMGQEERATLGAAGSTAARFMSIDNPRSLALLMLGSALFAIYVPRITEELKGRKAKEAEAATDDPKKEYGRH